MTLKQTIRTMLAVTLGLGAFLLGQLVIENSAWWVTGNTATFDEPLLNALRFGIAGAVGIAVAAMIGLAPVRRRRLL